MDELLKCAASVERHLLLGLDILLVIALNHVDACKEYIQKKGAFLDSSTGNLKKGVPLKGNGESRTRKTFDAITRLLPVVDGSKLKFYERLSSTNSIRSVIGAGTTKIHERYRLTT